MPTKADEDPLPNCADDNLAQACVCENIYMTENAFGGKKPPGKFEDNVEDEVCTITRP
jgi:hypothetical protein